ncbi:FxSxx-COOH system tetratricopeptide repeat protein [Streptomyces sp. NBC_01537]|uniref:FxSxx-COOH system tetratricopeptide repeat protein n=1 Tax=Streptomyces sp. NBC_01537 TaxID=2903896 RepID=UPI00386EAEBC
MTVEQQHFTISFAGFNRPWAAWTAHRLREHGHRVTLQRWDPPPGVPLEEALRDLLAASGTIVLVLSELFFASGARTDAEWNGVLRGLIADSAHRFAAVSLTDRTTPPAVAVLEPVELWGIDAGEAEHRLLTRLGLPNDRIGVDSGRVRAPRFPNDPPEVWGGVPRRNPRFTGRHAIFAQIQEELNKAPRGTAVVTLLGISGVGKTQIAAEYAYRFASDYDVVWWVPAQQRGTLRERLADLAPALGLRTGPDYGARIRAGLEALRRGNPHARWLTIFDSADDPQHLVELLPSGPGHVLITSRNREWAAHSSALMEIPLYARSESVSFVRRRARRLTESDADALAQVLEDYPLALDQTAGWLAESPMDVGAYVRLLESRMDNRDAVSVSSDYPVPFPTALAILLNNLRETSPEALQLLRLCVFFAAGPVPVRLLREIPADSLPEDLRWLMNDPLRWNTALNKLVQYSVVGLEYSDPQTGGDDPGSGAQAVQLHRMVHNIVRDGIPADEQTELSRAISGVLAAADPGRPDDTRQWPRYAELIPHLESSGTLASTDLVIQRFVLNCLRYLYNSGEYTTCLRLCEATYEHWNAALGEDHPMVREETFQYVNALRSTGRFRKAERLSRSVTEHLTDDRGERDLETLRFAGLLASVLNRLAKYAEAREIYERCWNSYRELLGEDDPLALNAQNNLAITIKLLGHYREAYDLDLDTLRRRERVLSTRHPFTLTSGTQCAIDLRLMGRYREALARQEQGMRNFVLTLGENHPNTLIAEHNLALCTRRAGDHAGAEDRLAGLVERCRQVLGPQNPWTLMVISDYAVLLRASGNLEGARRLHESVIQAYQRQLGLAHPYYLGSVGNLGLVLRAQGERHEALNLCEQALSGMRTTLGDEHPWTIGVALNTSACRNVVGQIGGAAELSRDTHRRATAVLGPEHPLTFCCQVAVASDLRGLNQRDEAAKQEEDVLQRLSRVLGPQHPQTIAAQNRTRPVWEFEPLPA